MRRALTEKRWDIILSAWSMPRFSAMAALKLLQELELELPFIIVSGTIGEEAAVDGVRAGASDYVLKDKLMRLAPAVEREVREADARKGRRDAEESLRLQEARFRALIEKSHDGILLTSSDGKTLYASPTAKRIIGSGHRDQLEAFDFVHPDDRASLAQARKRILERPNASAMIEFRVQLPDGSVRWVEGVGTNLLHEPAIAAIVVNFRDVTERKETVEALRVSETRFARLADSGIIGIVVSDLAGNMIDANEASLRMTGYSREDVREGRVLLAKVTPPEWSAGDAIAGEQLRTLGMATPWEKELLRKDGSRVPVLVGVAMLDHVKCITFLVDLTERKRAEEALHRTEDQLRHMQKMEAVGRLAGGVAHDFNNLLSVILSYAGLLLADIPEGDPMRGDVEEVKRAGERAANLTRQLLLFSRHQVVQPKVLDLNDLLMQMDKMLHRLIGEDVELTLLPAAMLGHVRIDRGHVEQVVMNLVVNARDAMPTGGKLKIETANVLLDEEFAQCHLGVKPGPHVMLAVSDTGVGMDPTTQAHMFEPFFTTKEIGQGTGLGLSTVFGIVQQGGGSIWVDSETSRGSTFKVYLPRVDENVDTLETREPSRSMGGSETILVVEDEEQVRAVVCGLLRRSGYRVMEAHNVAEAVLLCGSNPDVIHLLLTDIVMPEMSGPELARRVRVARPDMKVLCMSGYTDDSIVHYGGLDPCLAFVAKPFTSESLTTKVREVLDCATGAEQ
jgi:two-component system, cell cycle sensor histidine kinase and response regulator CckA